MNYAKLSSILLLVFVFYTAECHSKDKKNKTKGNIEFSNYSSSGIKNIGLNYFSEHTSSPSTANWQISSIEAAFAIVDKKSDFKAIILPRLNLGQRYDNSQVKFFERLGVQYQIESYLVLSKKNLLTLSYSYSDSEIFASHQALAEFGRSLASGWGISGAVRLMKWDQTLMSYSLGVEKYVSNLWITLKPSISIQDGKGFLSAGAGVRNYFANPVNFLHLGLSYGSMGQYEYFSPDVRTLSDMKSYGSYLLWQQHLFAGLCLRSSASFRREQYNTDHKWRNVLGFSVGMTLYLDRK